MYTWNTTRSGESSSSSLSTCSSWIVTSSSASRYPSRVARPSGGNNEYLIGLQKGLLASVRAGRIILTLTIAPSVRSVPQVSRVMRLYSLSLLRGGHGRDGQVDPLDAIAGLRRFQRPGKDCQEPLRSLLETRSRLRDISRR